VISIPALTDIVLTAMRSNGIMVGDGVAPMEGGWSSGTPNVAGFTPYTVLAFNGATPTNPEIVASDPDWSCAWLLRHFGGSREQADWVGDQMRNNVVATLKQKFGVADPYKVSGIVWSNLGALSRNDQVDPPYWQSQDSVTLLTSRSRI
jgi:hypothetical protein